MRAIRCIGSNRATRAACRRCFCRRSRRRRHPGSPAVFRSRALADRDLRSARRRPLDAARRDRRQHARSSGRRYRAPAPALGIEKWLVFGGSWGSTLALRLCRDPSAALHRARPARNFFVPARGDRLVSLWRAPGISRGVARLLGVSSRSRTQRYSCRLLPASDRSGSEHPYAGGARLGHLRGGLLDLAAQPRNGGCFRRGPAGARAWRESKRISSAVICSPASAT